MKQIFFPESGWNFRIREIIESHDLVFRAPVPDPAYGLPTGNGDSGCLLWLTENSLRVQLNKTDLWDNSSQSEAEYCPMEAENLTVCRSGGELIFDFGCPIFETIYQNAFEGRVSLYDAKVLISADTPFGKADISAYSSEKYGVSVFSTKISYTDALSLNVKLQRYGSRTMFFWYSGFKEGAHYGLGGTQSSCTGDTLLISQELNGTCFTLGVRIETATPFKTKKGGSHSVYASFEDTAEIEGTFYVAVVTGETAEKSKEEAMRLLDTAAAAGADRIYSEHAAAWADFWSKSFVTLPETEDFTENLWYLNLYYANCEMKGRSPAHFCNGIWGFYHDFVPWNHFFHYNMQLATFPLESANHPELLETYYNFRFSQLPKAKEYARKVKNRDGAFYTDVCDNFGRGDLGVSENCTCGAQLALYFYRHYLYSGDKKYLKEKALPMMTEAGKFYLDMLTPGDDGYYHIHGTQGYEGTPVFDDSITDHAMIRALFTALVRELPENERKVYAERLEKLYPYQTTVLYPEEAENGKFIRGLGKGLDTKGDRVLLVGRKCENGEWIRRTFGNPEHDYYGFPDLEMAPVFPSGNVGIKDRGTEIYNEIYNSICLHHPALKDDNPWGEDTSDGICMGWCMMPIYLARMGMGSLLKKYISQTVSSWINYPQGFGTYSPDDAGTFLYKRWEKYGSRSIDTGEIHKIPAYNFRHFDYETLPIIAASVNEMLIQSHDGILRLFGAVTKNDSYAFSLKAAGGFTVNAIYCRGEAEVMIKSLLGGELKLALDNVSSKVTLYDCDGRIINAAEKDGIFILNTLKGQMIKAKTENDAYFEREYKRNTDVKAFGSAKLGTEREFCR